MNKRLLALLGGGVLLGAVLLGAAWRLREGAQQTWGPPTALPQTLTPQGYPSLGYETAPLDLFLYEDFASPQSKRLHDETEPLVVQQYVAHNLIRLVSIPIAAVSQDSYRAAEAALCAARAGRYWAFRDVLYAQQGKKPFTRENLALWAEQVGIDRQRFYAWYDLDQCRDPVRQWNEMAKGKGVTGAPTLEIVGLGLIPGFRPFDDPDMPGVRQILDGALLEVMSK